MIQHDAALYSAERTHTAHSAQRTEYYTALYCIQHYTALYTKAGIRIRCGKKFVSDLNTEGEGSTAIKTYHLHYWHMILTATATSDRRQKFRP